MHTQGKLKHYKGRKKFKEARFIVAVDPKDNSRTFLAKVYGHQGQPVRENADRLVRSWECHDKFIGACEAALEDYPLSPVVQGMMEDVLKMAKS